MTKIAVPVVNGKLNGHFAQTQQFYIFKIKNKSVIEEEVMSTPSPEPGLYPKWLTEMGVTDVIVHNIEQKTIALFNKNKIHVFVGVYQKPPKELVLELLNGILETHDNTCSK
jgi:predicted Fe-Mo cluster-binding NifX family protein